LQRADKKYDRLDILCNKNEQKPKKPNSLKSLEPLEVKSYQIQNFMLITNLKQKMP
jgi:hypothetical protein